MMLAVALAILVQTAPAAPWEGVKENSWVLYRITEGDKKLEEKRTLLRIEQSDGVLKVEPKDGEARDERVSLVSPPAPEKNTAVGSKYDIDGAKLDCGVVEERQVQGSALGQAVIKIKKWQSLESPIPGWFLREERQTIVNSLTVKREMTRLLHRNVKVRVEGLSLNGWQTESTVEDEEKGTKMQELSWWSHDVPGWLVKQERKTTEKGKTTTRKLEVAKFEKLK